MIKTAVIGYGLSAKTFHLPFISLQPELELVAISSSQSQLRLDYPDIKHYSNGDELIRLSDAELVVITSPNDSHYPLAKQALLAGKHVLVEKPFVLTEVQGQELFELADEQQRQLFVYHNRRFDGDFLTLQQLLQTGELGTIRYFESHFDRFRPVPRPRWRELQGEGSGILYDLGPHLIDQTIALFGAPEALTARCRALRLGSDTVDYFHLLLHYADKEVVLHSSPFSAHPTTRFILQGDLGSYHKTGLDPQEDALRAGQKPGGAGWGQEPEALYGVVADAQGQKPYPTLAGDYQKFYQRLVAALQQGKPHLVSATEALQGIRLIELAMHSQRLGRTLDF
ncbi:oxidoreductase [Rheinheimera tangshanensis]|uniref:Oxidoreductase n=1 Tax=Rheinheimera tangshanensis TaxID=400153 RepID=A0A5C8M1M0_9GAMM|nr:oxidoreductase [Rheinheimera tangshanensis]MBP8226876.1 oxidoreductase [Rheinheimera sp.]TXK81290.1 oxidoreductase [Rheinheimera tangshanensis]GGM59638.1 oxidoreductase [Rheinheimera tangshanensis]